jgi:DNA-binding IscR family transcriptional regulator
MTAKYAIYRSFQRGLGGTLLSCQRLILLEKSGVLPVSSERMAGSINTNASFARRLVGTLAAAGLTTSQVGTGGGALPE